MNEKELTEMLGEVSRGGLDIQAAVEKMKHISFEDVGVAKIDHHRAIRKGFPEAVFGEGKTTEQLKTIVAAMKEKGSNILVTRLDDEKGGALQNNFPDGIYDTMSRCFTLIQSEVEKLDGKVAVICAGTSDLGVAGEAKLVCEAYGCEVDFIVDVGVAGIHRILSCTESLRTASVCIVVAGMEGALPSVVAGLVDSPVIAVPTSVGYGSGVGGFAALLGMLNSCGPGVVVVNIDNGFGAATAAALMMRKVSRNKT